MKLNLPEGKNIQKGELLLKINDSELQAQLRKLKTEELLAIEKESRQKKLLKLIVSVKMNMNRHSTIFN